MNRTIRIAGLLLASLTISTVALAQQGGGGGGGGGGGDGRGGGGSGGPSGSGGDTSVIELRLRDHEKARLTRPVAAPRGPNDCLTHACAPPPPPPPPRRNRPPTGEAAELINQCGGDTILVQPNRAGQIIRHYCENRWAGR